MEFDVLDQLKTQNIVERELKKQIFETAAQKNLFAECMDSKYMPHLREAGENDSQVCRSLSEKFAHEVYEQKLNGEHQGTKKGERTTSERALEFAEGLRLKMRSKLGIPDENAITK